MRTSELFGAKKLRILRNLWCVCTDKGAWVDPMWKFVDKGGGVNFLRFCADVLNRGPLPFTGTLLVILFPENTNTVLIQYHWIIGYQLLLVFRHDKQTILAMQVGLPCKKALAQSFDCID